MRALRSSAVQQAARQLWMLQDAWAALGCSSSSNSSSTYASTQAHCSSAPGSSCSTSSGRSYSTAQQEAAPATTSSSSSDLDATALPGEVLTAAEVVESSSMSEVAAWQQLPSLDQPRPWHYVEDPSTLSNTVITDSRSLDLASPNVGDYYPFSSSLVPEAFRSFHQAFYPPRPAHLQRRGGCRGLQAEFAASGSSHLMWRRCMQDLSSFLAASAQDPNQIRRALLGGPSGTGKSVAVAALVEQARTCGEVVVYVPDATALVSGGFFYRREDGTFDTIISAQHILKSVVDSHKEQLQGLMLMGQMPKAGGGSEDSNGKTLLDLAMLGLSTDDDARLAVDCCRQLLQELAKASEEGLRVLFAIDNYNALHGPTDYGINTTHSVPGGSSNAHGAARIFRRMLGVRELNLAYSFRLLARADLGQARVLAATTSSGVTPPDARIKLRRARDVLQYNMPRFSQVEVAHMLHYYYERGLVEMPSPSQVEKLRAITNGSGADLRRLGPRTAQLDTNVL